MPQFRRMPFLLAASVSVSLVLAAPFLGEIRRAILLRFPGQFGRILGAVVLGAVGLALLGALARIRTGRRWRYALLLAALAAGVGYAAASATGEPQVDAVERFHFVEYGIVTLLFYRAWRPASDVSSLVLPVLAGLLVGTVEEWFQWFIPARVGEARDVFLNGVAIACGLMFSVAVDPPVPFRAALAGPALRRIGAFAAVVVLVFGAFFDTVHVGHTVSGEGGTFRSAYTGAELEALNADRARAWRNRTVERPPRLSAEDQYLTEGHWHVAARNTAWAAGDVLTAWNENLILEQYFGSVLDTPSYLSPTGHRLSPEHRADAERRLAGATPVAVFESRAHPSAIYAWPGIAYWIVVSATALGLAAPWVLARSGRMPGAALAGSLPSRGAHASAAGRRHTDGT